MMNPVVEEPSVLARAWTKLSRLPGGRHLFSRVLGRTVPYSRTIKPYVADLGPGYAKLQIRITHPLTNHIGSAHAMVLGNLAELTGGLALTFAMPASLRLVAAKFTLEYKKRGYGRLTAESNAPLLDWTLPKQVVEVEVFIRDEAGDVVVRGVGEYHISRPKG